MFPNRRSDGLAAWLVALSSPFPIALWTARAVFAEWRRTARALRESRRLQYILLVVVGRFRRRCNAALQWHRLLSRDALRATVDAWWIEAAINALNLRPLALARPRQRRHG